MTMLLLLLLGARDRVEPVKRAGAKQASPRAGGKGRGQGPPLRRRLHHLLLHGEEEQKEEEEEEVLGEYSSCVTGHSRVKMFVERQQ